MPDDTPTNPTPDLEDATRVLRDRFGYDAFRGPQARVIERTLAGQHTLLLMPTGGGKSLCYQAPALLLDGLTVVISPLIALMKDQVDALTARGIDATYINASLRRSEREDRYAGLREGRYKLLYVTPERFRKEDFVAALATQSVSLLAIDEAHCISSWGHDFRPDYTRLTELRQIMGNPTTLAVTATATPRVQSDIADQLGLAAGNAPDQIATISTGIDRPNLSLEVAEVWGDDEKLEHITKAISTLADAPSSDKQTACLAGSGIVYFALIRTLEKFSDRLREAGVDHLCYHGRLEAQNRRRVQNRFMSGEGPAVVLATNAFGMGIDKADIRFVVHAEAPGSIESYYQEIGRAGRDGLPALCRLLYDQHDLETQMAFIRWSNPGAEFYQRVVHHLEHDGESIRAFGLDWLREKLHAKRRHDFRLDTALNMLHRHGVIAPDGGGDEAADLREGKVKVTADLPQALLDEDLLDAKRKGDQERLLSIVQYVRCEGDRRVFLNDYFGVGPTPPREAAR